MVFPYFLGEFESDDGTTTDTTILVCVPVSLRNPDVSGTEARCFDCSTEVAVAETSKSFLKERRETIIVCPVCADIRMGEEQSGEEEGEQP